MTIMLVALCVSFVSCGSKDEPELAKLQKIMLPAQVGDFYMNDGTWLPGATILTTEQMANCIGIVYWTGDPTTNDPALKAAHPTCTHGLVVALNEPEKTAWQVSSSDVNAWIIANTSYTPILSVFGSLNPINQILGYNNTKAIEAFNADAVNSGNKVNVIEKVITYRKAVPTPTGNSGWFLPSVKELALLSGLESQISNVFESRFGSKNRNFINSQLAKISAATQINNSEYYYSSTERNQDFQWFIFFGANSFLSKKKSDVSNARFVSAF